MRIMISRARFYAAAAALLAACAAPAAELRAQAGDPASDLVGLWKAKRRFGPDARGPLIVERTGAGYTADMMGFTVPVRVNDGELSFELPNREGAFRGRPRAGGAIRGFWFPGAIGGGSLGAATPVTLLPKGRNRWSGQVVPLDDEQTFYLLVSRRPDGSLAALLRNIERDYGALLGVRGLVRTGNAIELVGRRGAQTRDTVLVAGSFDSARQVITLDFPYRGGSYDFRRDDDDQSAFYPRGRRPARYVYRVPPALDDGWATASVDEVGIDRAAVERLVQQLADMSMDSINAPQVHSLLIARGGRLVLEEYFHGEHRGKLHNERSGSKSVTATIVGAAMLAGAPLRLSTPVYQAMNGGAFPPGLEPRKRAMTLEHLLTMSSGYFCDDNDEAAPGREDGMWQQTEEPDFYAFTLKLPMATAPGEKAVYCSINPNLALGVAGRAAGESPFYLFDRLVAAPLDIGHYAWTLDRARNPYGGGGMAFFTRDFMKFGQLMLDGGTWRGRRILGREFVARATSPLYRIGERGYGLAWWREEKPYRNGTVQGFAALGAGGQIVMVFPELELVVATNGGSYSSRGWRYLGGELIPNILPAVRASR
ncbi:MAG TPA: serine hydrolase [Longimicrobium sp.]|jgi:CubicO group peptidase (beta-lactamase class C family)